MKMNKNSEPFKEAAMQVLYGGCLPKDIPGLPTVDAVAKVIEDTHNMAKAREGESGLTDDQVNVGDSLILCDSFMGRRAGDVFTVTGKTSWQVITTHAGETYRLGNNGLRFFVRR